MPAFVPPTGAGPTANQLGVNLAVTGIGARWSPGIVPHLIRYAAIKHFVTINPDAAIHCRFTGDISAQGTATELFKIVIPTSGAIDKTVYYKPTYRIEIPVGAMVDVNVTAAATAGVYGKVMLWVEPRWEQPTNVTSMLHTS